MTDGRPSDYADRVLGEALTAATGGLDPAAAEEALTKAIKAIGTTGGSSTIATGSVTPSQANELIIATACHDSIYTSTVNSSFTISDDNQGAGSAAYGSTMAYLIQGSAGAVNPIFAGEGSAHFWAAAIATFKAAAGGAPVGCIIGGGLIRAGCPG